MRKCRDSVKVNLRIYLVGIVLTCGLVMVLLGSGHLQMERLPGFLTALVNCLGLTMIVVLMSYGLV